MRWARCSTRISDVCIASAQAVGGPQGSMAASGEPGHRSNRGLGVRCTARSLFASGSPVLPPGEDEQAVALVAVQSRKVFTRLYRRQTG